MDLNKLNETYKVTGMTCAACAKAVERSVKKIDGVSDQSVNIATEKLTIEYDSNKVNFEDIKHVEEIEEKNIEEDKIKKEKEMKSLLTKFIIATVFSIPLFYIAMGPMVIKPFGPWPVPEIINPMTNTLNYALIQLLLVIPVMGAGYK